MDKEKKRFVEGFELIKNKAEIRVLSNLSLENPLSDKQYERITYLKDKLFNK